MFAISRTGSFFLPFNRWRAKKERIISLEYFPLISLLNEGTRNARQASGNPSELTYTMCIECHRTLACDIEEVFVRRISKKTIANFGAHSESHKMMQMREDMNVVRFFLFSKVAENILNFPDCARLKMYEHENLA